MKNRSKGYFDQQCDYEVISHFDNLTVRENDFFSSLGKYDRLMDCQGIRKIEFVILERQGMGQKHINWALKAL